MEAVYTADERDILAHFDALPRTLRDNLIARLGPVDARMLAIVRAAAPVRTGRLRSEIHGAVVDSDRGVLAKVFVAGATAQDLAKAGALEWGVPGASSRSASRAPGGMVSVRAYQRLRGESVGSYRRRMRLEARRFMRRAISAMQAEGAAAIEQAVADTIATI